MIKPPFYIILFLITISSSLKKPVFAQKSYPTMSPKIELVYVYDALCGWCYGFSKVMEKVQATYGDNVQVEVISGGLIRGERVGPYGEFANYIKNAIPQLEQTSGVKVGDAFIKRLDDPSAIQDSKPPALALAAFRSIQPQSSLDFAHLLQKSHFIDGNSLNDVNHFALLASKLGLNQEAFLLAYEKAAENQWDEEDFRQSSQLGVRGFPALFLKKDDKYVPVANGYVPFDELNKRLR